MEEKTVVRGLGGYLKKFLLTLCSFENKNFEFVKDYVKI